MTSNMKNMRHHYNWMLILAVLAWSLPSKAAEPESITLDTVFVRTSCPGETVTLTAVSGDGSDQYAYVWSTGATTRSITVPVTAASTQDYFVNVYSTRLVVKYNLIVNGDFEMGSAAFTSSYYYAGHNPQEYYDSHPGAYNLYAITTSTKYFSHYFYADLYPHGGTYMALFDAGESGFAWKATTTDNPKLKVKKDSIYQFSYWAANTGDNSTTRARLQFKISYRGSDGNMHTQMLGAIHSLGIGADINAWEYNMINWTAPENSDYLEISVEDLENAWNGNDFVLDDIIFQNKYSYLERDPWRKEPFRISTDHCPINDTICLGEQYTKYGYQVKPTAPAMTKPMELTSGQKHVFLTVLDTIRMTFNPDSKYCVDKLTSIAVPMSMTSAYQTMHYSVTFSDKRFKTISDAVYSGQSKLSIALPSGMTYPATVKATVQAWSNEYQRTCPSSREFSFTVDICDTHDTICLGEQYTKYGYNLTPTTATAGTPMILTGGIQNISLTVLDTIVVTYKVEADICPPNRQVTATVLVKKDQPYWYSLWFSNEQMSPIINQTLTNNEIVVSVPESVTDKHLRVDVELASKEDKCSALSSFEVDLHKDFYVYAKWDDVLIVDNGQAGYQGRAISYQWYHDGAAVPGANKQSYYAPNNMNGEFFVEVMTDDGSVKTTCPFIFGDIVHSVTQNNASRSIDYQEERIDLTPNFYLIRRQYSDGETEVQKIVH